MPAKTEPGNAARARAMFNRFLPRSYSLSLGDLSEERWSILPPQGHLAVEFRSSRHGWLTYARSAGDPEDIALFDRDRGRNLSLYASAEHVARRGRFYDEDDTAAYDVLGYGVDVTFDPSRTWISGRGRLRIRILAEAAQNLSFRLAEPLAVASATSPELGRLLPLRIAGQTTMLVSLPEVLRRGREITIDLAYSGRLEPQGWGRVW